MNKPGQKKLAIYAVVLVGALTALALDRFRGPSSADAASVSGLKTGAGESVELAEKQVTQGPAIAHVFASDTAEHQSTSARPGAPRDAFSMTPEMQLAYVEESPEKKAEAERVVESEEELRRRQVEEFTSNYKLKGTTLRKDVAWAIINDQVVRVGEVIGGFRLERVERYRVHLVRDGLSVALTLPTPL